MKSKLSKKELRNDLKSLQDRGYSAMGYFGYVKGDPDMDDYTLVHDKLSCMDQSPFFLLEEEQEELYNLTWDLHNNFEEYLDEVYMKNCLKNTQQTKLTKFLNINQDIEV